MATQDDLAPEASSGTTNSAVVKSDVETLHMNAIGVIGLVAGAAGAVAPLAAMFFNVPFH